MRCARTADHQDRDEHDRQSEISHAIILPPMCEFRSASQRAAKKFFSAPTNHFNAAECCRSSESTFMLMMAAEEQQECRPRDRAARPAARKRQRFMGDILSDMVETDLLALNEA
jgi:hypothetical protein